MNKFDSKIVEYAERIQVQDPESNSARERSPGGAFFSRVNGLLFYPLEIHYTTLSQEEHDDIIQEWEDIDYGQRPFQAKYPYHLKWEGNWLGSPTPLFVETSGREITFKNFVANTNGVGKKDDHIYFENKMYQLTSDVNSGSDGRATFTVNGPIYMTPDSDTVFTRGEDIRPRHIIDEFPKFTASPGPTGNESVYTPSGPIRGREITRDAT